MYIHGQTLQQNHELRCSLYLVISGDDLCGHHGNHRVDVIAEALCESHPPVSIQALRVCQMLGHALYLHVSGKL